MARRRKTRVPPETFARFAVRVQGYEVWSEARVNRHVRHPQYSFYDREDDPLFEHITQLRVWGASTYPPERAGPRCEFTVVGDDAPSRGLAARVKDAQARDKDGLRKYRKYRGGDLPVYEPPSGFGLLDKVRGEPSWNAWVTVAPRLVTDWLILLGSGRDLYLQVAERKAGRSRWLVEIGLQTSDPAEELGIIARARRAREDARRLRLRRPDTRATTRLKARDQPLGKLAGGSSSEPAGDPRSPLRREHGGHDSCVDDCLVARGPFGGRQPARTQTPDDQRYGAERARPVRLDRAAEEDG